jgi:hypothetical protein
MKTQTTKRFTDPWWLSLGPTEKLVLDYIAENCDCAGLIEFKPLEWEFVLGLHKLPEEWVNLENPGVHYDSKTLCADDTANQGLSDAKIRRRPPADWTRIVTALNSPPKEIIGVTIPQVVVIGECKWWYPRAIERRFGLIVRTNAVDVKGEPVEVLKIKIDENLRKHKRTVKILRAAGLLEQLRGYYPELELVEAPSQDELQRKLALAAKGADQFIPEMAEVLAEKITPNLTEEARKVWFFLEQQRDWRESRKAGWRAALTAYAAEEQLKAQYLGLIEDIGGRKWPTEGERQAHLEWIADRILSLNQEREPSNAGPVLTKDARARITILQAVQKIMEREQKGDV